MDLKYAPYAAIIDQTILCNQECGFCWRTDREAVKVVTKEAPYPVMPFELYGLIVDEVAKVNSVKSLSLCGPMGEPTLVPDLAERGAYARRKTRFADRTLINTNGVALDKHDPEALLLGFSDIQVSLDANDEQTYAQIHGKPGQFDRVVRNIEMLIHTKWKLGKRAGRVALRCTETSPGDGRWEALSSRWASRVDAFIHKYVHTFVDVVPKRDGLAADAAQHCNQPHGSINFTYAGELTTCCINYHREPTFGRLGKGNTLKELWESQEFESWRATRLSGLCHACSGLGSVSQKIQGVA